MGRGSRLAGALGGAVLAGVFGTGCASDVSGTGLYAESPATQLPVPGGTETPSGTPDPTPSTSPSTQPSQLPASSAPPAVPSFPAAFAGSWTGQINQPSSTLPQWTALLTMPGGTMQGTFEIAGYCKGVLTLLSTSANRLIAVERITSDPKDVCANSGGVTLELSGANRATFRWVDYSDNGNVATGTIARR
jgi:hypothetical protein